jgi:hypothetical protein
MLNCDGKPKMEIPVKAVRSICRLHKVVVQMIAAAGTIQEDSPLS